jgi:hypothetical protein
MIPWNLVGEYQVLEGHSAFVLRVEVIQAGEVACYASEREGNGWQIRSGKSEPGMLLRWTSDTYMNTGRGTLSRTGRICTTRVS